MKPFFNFKASASGDTLQILDEIGPWGLHESDFAAQLAARKGATLTVEINSPGGDVFAAVAMFNMLKASGKQVTTRVLGLAASAASIIMMAGSTREMPSNSFVMIHSASAFNNGNALAHRKLAGTLDKIDESLATLYVRQTGLATAEIKAMLAAETWLEASEALSNGFATRVTDAIQARATFDMKAAKLPEHVKAIFGTQKPRPVDTAAEIKALCSIANRSQDAAGFVAAGNSIAQVRAALLQTDTVRVSTASLWNNHHKQGAK